MSADALRILVGLESSGPGGAENMVVSLAEGLTRAGHPAAITTDQPGWMTERAASHDIPVWIETQHRGFEWLWILRLARRMRRERIDVFHSHEFSMNIFGGAAAWLARVPHVATIHGRRYVTEAPRRVAAYRFLRRRGVPIVAVSDDLREFLATGFGLAGEQLERVHNGIALPTAPSRESHTRDEARKKARGRLDLPDSGALLVCIGNLYPVKDHANLVRALPTLTDARVAIAGRGAEKENLRSLASELGVADRLHLLGLRDDVSEILGAADIFVHPSRSEGLPLAVLEAMGHGLPIVASRVGGIPEAIDHQETGLLVPPGEPAALAHALSRLLENPELREELGRRARARAESEFSMDSMVERYARIYRRIAS